LCITCGLDAAAGTSMNRLPDGRVCPTCAERLLETLPPLFPGFGHLLDETTGYRRLPAPRLVNSAPKRPRRPRKDDAQ
jgi:hypothetical protein